jgi:uncharacterized membrane protein
MKVLCKRTYFTHENNLPVFEKDKYYSIIEKNDYSISIKNNKGVVVFLNANTFNRYFIDINELRDKKINEILNR